MSQYLKLANKLSGPNHRKAVFIVYLIGGIQKARISCNEYAYARGNGTGKLSPVACILLCRWFTQKCPQSCFGSQEASVSQAGQSYCASSAR